jgi:DNA-binding GntR family transcriptional regulator
MTLPPDSSEPGTRAILRGRVADALRAALVSGELRPGQTYSAPTLAAKFGVSATPVREAMLALAKEGLVVTAPNKGFRLRELSTRELHDNTEIRRYLEIPGTVAAVDHATPQRIKRLRALAQRIIDAGTNRDFIAFVDNDRQFHLDLLGWGGNRELVSMVGSLRDRARLYGLDRLAESGELSIWAQEHVELTDLIESGDRAGLAALMEKHIAHVRGDGA